MMAAGPRIPSFPLHNRTPMKHIILLLSIILAAGMASAAPLRYMYVYALAYGKNSCNAETALEYRSSVVDETREVAEKKRLSDELKAAHPSATWVRTSSSYFDSGPDATCVAVIRWTGGTSNCPTNVISFAFGKSMDEALDKANKKFDDWAPSGAVMGILDHRNFLIPTITQQPKKSQSLPKGQKLKLYLCCDPLNPLTYIKFEWRKDGRLVAVNPSPSEFSNAPASSTNSSTFEIDHVMPSDAGVYDCVITNEGGSVISAPAKLTVTPPVPDIALEQPAGSNLASGTATKSFGTVKVGNTGSAKTFTIRNKGYAKLTDISIRASGKHPADFVVTKPLKTALAPGDSTTFKVSFKPAAATTRSASLRISSNDPDEEPFTINLTGQGAK